MQTRRIGLLLLVVIAVLLVIGVTQSSQSAPGQVWKVNFTKIPEMQEIYDAFRASCVVPDIPESWKTDSAQSVVFQEMRNDAWEMNETKYTLFETQPMQESKWALPVMKFYGNQYMIHAPVAVDPETLFSRKQEMQKGCQKQIRQLEYTPRLGCYHRHISEDLERLASEKINAVMTRLQLPNRLKHLSDSRGATFMPSGGFMECHTNRNHLAGWRLYFHHLPNNGESTFIYKHSYDGSIRRIKDSNFGANMFRIRREPAPLLWHAIHSNTERFSWGLWIPPELAQFLKSGNVRI